MFREMPIYVTLAVVAFTLLLCVGVAACLIHELRRELAEASRDRERAHGSLAGLNTALGNRIKELHNRHGQLDSLTKLSAELQLSESAEQAYPVFASYLQRLFPDTTGAVCILNPSSKLLEPVAHWGSNPPLGAFAVENCCRSAVGRKCVAGPASSNLLCGHFRQEQTTSCLCIPMQAQAQIIGSLHIVYPDANFDGETSELLSDSQHQLARAVADQAAITLANLQLRERLRSEAIRDPLTGLYNRRYMEESFEREVQRAERNQTGLSLLWIDLDHFKQFNDSFGHPAGDRLLSEAGHLLCSRLRGHDIVCRYGGEEFAVVMPEVSLETARARAEELCSDFRALCINLDGRPLKSVTASIGVADFPADGKTASELLAAADEALYRAKRQGRDRVVLATAVSKADFFLSTNEPHGSAGSGISTLPFAAVPKS